MNQELIRGIDYAIKNIWMGQIAEDYSNSHILKEDSLKSCYYHHLRNELGPLFEKEGLRVYTEFNEKGLKTKGWRADIAIVRLGAPENRREYLGSYAAEVLAIIELKLQPGGSRGTQNIFKDIDKMKDYVRCNRFPDCQYYLGMIHEDVYPLSELQWLRKRQSGSWANGRVSELNACRFQDHEEEGMGFTVMSYNKMNEGFNWRGDESIKYVDMNLSRWDCVGDRK